MPPQEEHEKIENLVDQPGQAANSARTLEDMVDSHGTLDGYRAMNNVKPSEELEREAREDNPRDREKGHPVP